MLPPYSGNMSKSKIVSSVALLVVVALIIAKFFFIDFAIVPQNGMFPGVPAGNFIFFTRRSYSDVADVRRGDVVLFDRVERDGKQYRYVWRVIGLPGDQIEIVRDLVMVNGQSLQRERLRQDGDLVIFREMNSNAIYEVAYPQHTNGKGQPTASVTVPEKHLFVLGDNRYDAVDSRYFGPISFSSIMGKKL
jgi:signal peptidase I